jgi:hypothetical protein
LSDYTDKPKWNAERKSSTPSGVENKQEWRTKTMNYTKPTIVSLGNAVECVQSTFTKHCGPTDSTVEYESNIAAYEADE